MEPDELLRYVIEALEGIDVPYALAGSIASIAYGEPRSTLDIDLVADLQHQDVARLKGRFPAPEFYLSEEAAAEAVEHRHQFNIIHPASGFKVDVFVIRSMLRISGAEINQERIRDLVDERGLSDIWSALLETLEEG